MQPAQPGFLEMMFPFVIIIVIFYFLILRPQSKRVKLQEKFLSELKRGDQIITTGGIFGTIEGLTPEIATIVLEDGTKMKMLRKNIAGSQASLLKVGEKTEVKK